jgi:hypothetical protein
MARTDAAFRSRSCARLLGAMHEIAKITTPKEE